MPFWFSLNFPFDNSVWHKAHPITLLGQYHSNLLTGLDQAITLSFARPYQAITLSTHWTRPNNHFLYSPDHIKQSLYLLTRLGNHFIYSPPDQTRQSLHLLTRPCNHFIYLTDHAIILSKQYMICRSYTGIWVYV